MSGLDVSLIGRPRVLDAITTSGLHIEFPSNGVRVAHPAVLNSPPANVAFDVVFVTVRAFDISSAAPVIETLSGGRGLIFAFQNGVGSDQQLLHTIDRNRVIAASLTASVGFTGPGTVRQYNSHPGIAWSEYAPGNASDRISDVLTSTGLPVWKVHDPASLRWSKLLLNTIGSAQSFILDMEISEIVARTDLFRIEQLAFREAVAVMRAAGIQIVDLPGYRVTMASRVMALSTSLARVILGPRIAQGRGGKPPSLVSDRERGKSLTESDYLNGAVAAAGHDLHIPTPVSLALNSLVGRLAQSDSDRLKFKRKPQALLDFLRGEGAALAK
jgi:2-dehydropantoate 2-reductase